LKIHRDIRSSRCITSVFDTGGKWKKSSIIKVLIILFGHLWKVELTYRYIYAFKFTLRSQQPDIVPMTPVANSPPASTTVVKLGVIDTSDAPGLRISPRIFEKILNGPNWILWGRGETES
jgi:hypothetical protein